MEGLRQDTSQGTDFSSIPEGGFPASSPMTSLLFGEPWSRLLQKRSGYQLWGDEVLVLGRSISALGAASYICYSYILYSYLYSLLANPSLLQSSYN